MHVIDSFLMRKYFFLSFLLSLHEVNKLSANMDKILTVEQLQRGEEAIEKSIYDYAKKQNLSNENFMPITDGVCSLQKYLASSPRIMWVLKEPYDDKDESGEPKGGDWSIPKDCFKKDDAWKNCTWQPIIYSMFGLYNKLTWEEMDLIRNNHLMADILQGIAYINVSKMPALTNSSRSPMDQYYQNWKSILWEQINLYKPNVIIFGRTFDYFSNDFFGANGADTNDYVKAYKKDDILLLDTYHPNARPKGFRRGDYVGSIIDAINKLSINQNS